MITALAPKGSERRSFDDKFLGPNKGLWEKWREGRTSCGPEHQDHRKK